MIKDCRYIIVEGPIGVGKTTLVQALATRLQARTVYEVFEENPFLADFYGDPDRFAFSTEMFFLLSRFNQQETFAQEDLFQRYAVSDYLFEKCRIFAELTLGDAEFGLFSRMYDILSRQIPVPDLVIHLHAPIDVLLGRIGSRGRSYEAEMDPEYLRSLDQRYHALFSHYTDAPVISIDTTHVDFRTGEALDALIRAINAGERGVVELGS